MSENTEFLNLTINGWDVTLDARGDTLTLLVSERNELLPGRGKPIDAKSLRVTDALVGMRLSYRKENDE